MGKNIDILETLIVEDEIMKHKIYTLNYITAGTAIFTLESTKLKTHYTYHITKDKKNKSKDLFRVYCLFGQDNTATGQLKKNWRFIGYFVRDVWKLELPQFKKMDINLPTSIAMFKSFLSILTDNMKTWPSGCKFYKSEFCCVCGRRLTTPESVKAGVGPRCLDRTTRILHF